jgi:hypothetical protein
MFNQAPDVKDQPLVVTDTWRTYVIDNEIHLVCVMPNTGKIRTTTPVQLCDPITQIFETKTGRIYQCLGPMAPNALSFRMTLMLNGLIDDVDSFTGEPDSMQ